MAGSLQSSRRGTDTMNQDQGEHWRMLDHPADILIEVWGDTLEELFVHGAEAFGCLVGESGPEETEEEVGVEAHGETEADLMIDWLRELLFLHETRRLVPTGARITELTSTDLRGQVSVRRLRPDEVPPYEIKAVTYHGVFVDRTDQRYQTRVLFDV